MSQLEEYQINVYDFPNYEKEPEEDKLIPFAVVGSNVVVQDESGKRVRGRKYPWGTVNIEDKNHCDFLSLRSLVLAHHMQVRLQPGSDQERGESSGLIISVFSGPEGRHKSGSL